MSHPQVLAGAVCTATDLHNCYYIEALCLNLVRKSLNTLDSF